MRKKNKIRQMLFTVLLIILCVLVVFPFLLLVSVSLSSEKDIAIYGYSIIPKKIDFSAYQYVFKDLGDLLQAYKVTAIFSFVTMFLGVFFMAMIAYAISLQRFRFRKGLSFYLYFTLLFSGGLAPTYILITKYLHLTDSIWVYILPALINPWSVFMLRTFFADIPHEIQESALMDGAEEYQILFRIILPLSTPALATIGLLLFLSQWNNWMTAMLYINNQKLISLQYLLQRIMENIDLLSKNKDMQMMVDVTDLPSETARMAMAVLVAGPALLIFPFFQKYFVRGLTVGSVKG